jgi:predicted ATPase
LRLFGYTIVTRIAEGSHASVYAAVRARDGIDVVIKAGKAAPEGASSPVRREFDLLCRIASPRVVRALDFEIAGDVEALILERFPGISLRQLLAKQPLAIPDFLTVAIEVAEGLADIHAARIVHRDVSLKNVLVDPASLAVCMIDLGISSDLGSAQRHGAGTIVEGTMRYISPEQTGRLGQGVDFRSDLYSLGVCFYELLTAEPPFSAPTASELILAHIARVPVLVSELRPDIPLALARLVAKLLEKDPERRYQTASGLRTDLLECQRQLARDGRIDPALALGQHDALGRLRFAQRIYGRQAELATLASCFSRARTGRLEVALICGAPGSGKSALTEELRGTLAGARGYMGRAKLDRYRRDRPYAGFVDAFEELIDQLLAGSAEDVELWRERLSSGLGKLAGALDGILPGLKLLLGPLPALRALGPRETRQQLAVAFQRLTVTLATPEHPLVLLFDDLQWADAGSRYLLEELLRDAASSALLVIATYASADAPPAPFDHSIASGAPITRIDLGPLPSPALQLLLADVLGRSADDVRSLTERIGLRTGANPQLVREFLLRLQESGGLRPQDGAAWVWDDVQVDAAPPCDAAVELAMPRIRALAQSAREILTLASCMGDVFDPETLLKLCGRNRLDLFRDLILLANECLIALSPQGFRFVHNRIREAAQALLTDAERAQHHARIGRFLVERTPPEALASQALVIADHFNRAPAPTDDAVRMRRIELNVMAAHVALGSGASASADGYVEVALALHRVADWNVDTRLCLRLHLCKIDSAMSTGRYAEAERDLDFLEQRSLGLLQAARVAARRIAIRTIANGPRSGVEAALDALARLGILRWSARPSWLRVWLEVLATRRMLRRETVFEATRSLDRQRDERWVATLLLLGELGPGAYREEMRLALLASCVALRGQAARGVRVHAVTLASFAHCQAAFTHDYASAGALASRALKMLESHPDGGIAQQVKHQIYVMVRTWVEPRRDQLAPLREVEAGAFELGNNETALYAQFWHACLLMLVGEPLQVAERDLTAELERAQRVSVSSWALRLGVLSALRPLTRASGAGEPVQRVPAEAHALIASSRHYANVIGTFQIMVDYMLRHYDDAFMRCEEVRESILRAGSSTPHVSEYFLFRGLIAAARFERVRAGARRGCRTALAESLRLMRRWAQACPANFAHLVLLLEAERARTGGARGRAIELYADAARGAEAQRYRQHAALAHERRATLLWELGRGAEASDARALAIAAYSSWGARAKVAQLEQRDGGHVTSGRGAP